MLARRGNAPLRLPNPAQRAGSHSAINRQGPWRLIYRTQLGPCQRHTFTVFVLATVGHVPLRNGRRELVGGVFPTLRGQTPAGDRPQLATIG